MNTVTKPIPTTTPKTADQFRERRVAWLKAHDPDETGSLSNLLKEAEAALAAAKARLVKAYAARGN